MKKKKEQKNDSIDTHATFPLTSINIDISRQKPPLRSPRIKTKSSSKNQKITKN